VNCDRIVAELPQFQPRWTVRAGVEELHAAYLRHGLTEEQLTGQRLQRIKHVRRRQELGEVDTALRIVESVKEVASV
jgi:hypothetical protein